MPCRKTVCSVLSVYDAHHLLYPKLMILLLITIPYPDNDTEEVWKRKNHCRITGRVTPGKIKCFIVVSNINVNRFESDLNFIPIISSFTAKILTKSQADKIEIICWHRRNDVKPEVDAIRLQCKQNRNLNTSCNGNIMHMSQFLILSFLQKLINLELSLFTAEWLSSSKIIFATEILGSPLIFQPLLKTHILVVP